MDSIPTPYPELNDVLHQLLTRMDGVLGHNLLGLYLQGSFAIGDYDQHSDVDYIAVIRQPIPDHQLPALQDMHRRLYRLKSSWAQHLEGSYFPIDLLQDYQQTVAKLWYLDNGSQELERSDHCNTIVVRWTLREHGIPLSGPDPKSLIDPIPVAVLQREIAMTMNQWGQEILDDPERYKNRFYQGFIVLNFCRMLHDLITGDVSSKQTSAEWAKQTLEPSWHGLIDRAWRTRPNPAISVKTPPDPADFDKTLAFVTHILRLGKVYELS